MKKMSTPSRIMIALASLAMVATYFLPVWFIFLIAPQYPEGLEMNIWLDKITGQVEIINGLNHYIGMKHISSEMFPEFGYMIYIVGFYIVFGLVVAAVGKRSLLLVYNLLLVAVGLLAMYDFYSWGYDYGHNLDPKAAIQVPGLSYQPPLFGHKQLLNFDAYSYPDIGGWIVIGAAVVFFGVWILEWRRARKAATQPRKKTNLQAASIAALVLLFSSCSTEPEPFQYGKDMCASCKMTIMVPKFAAQIVTKKGRVFKFDDAHCVASYTATLQAKDIAKTVFNDFSDNTKFVDARTAYFVQSPNLKSPMNGNSAAFASKAAAEQIAAQNSTALLSWDELKAKLK